MHFKCPRPRAGDWWHKWLRSIFFGKQGSLICMPGKSIFLLQKAKKNKIAIGTGLDFHPPPSTTVSCREGEEMVAQHKQGKSDRSHLTKGIIQFSQQSSYYNLFRRRPKKSQLCYPWQNLPKTHKRRHIITLPKHLFPPFLTFYLLFALIRIVEIIRWLEI